MARHRNRKNDRELLARMEEALDSLDDAPYRAYWSALGQFIHTLSAAEHKLLLLLRKYAGLRDRSAGIIFSGTRGEQAREWIRALLDASKRTAIKARLEGPLGQFAAINTARNNIVHWGAKYDRTNKYLLVSNKKLSPAPGKRREFPISVVDLETMIADLRLIIFFFDQELDGMEPDSNLALLMRRTWLYKPPQPSRNLRKPRRGPKGHKRPQPS